MKQSTKIVLIIAGCLIGGGLLLMLCGWVTGGRRDVELVYRDHAWQAVEQADAGWSGKTLRESNTFADVGSLSISLSMGELVLREDGRLEAGAVRVSYALPEELAPSVALEQGTLRFTSYGELPMGREVHWGGLFSWPFLHGPRSGRHEASVEVYYGPGTFFDTASINNAMGDVSVYELKARALQMESDLGELYLEDAAITETTGITLSAGNLELEDCSLGQAQIECAMGNIEGDGVQTAGLTASANMGDVDLAGVFQGLTQLDCAMGAIEIETGLPRAAYNLDFEASMGYVEVNGHEEGRRLREDNPGAANTIEGSCNMGSIEAHFSRD